MSSDSENLFRVKASLLRDTLKAVNALADEPSLRMDSEAWSLRAMDPSRVSLVDVVWPKTVFETFVLDKPNKACFNIDQLLKLVKQADEDPDVEIELSFDWRARKINISILDADLARTFTLPLLDSGDEDVPKPKIDFKAVIKMSLTSLQKAIADANVVSDHVCLCADVDKLSFSAGSEGSDAKTTLKKENAYSFECGQQQKALFSLSFFSEMLKYAESLADIVTLRFSGDMPFQLELHQHVEAAKLSFWLAPRIEREE